MIVMEHQDLPERHGGYVNTARKLALGSALLCLLAATLASCEDASPELERPPTTTPTTTTTATTTTTTIALPDDLAQRLGPDEHLVLEVVADAAYQLPAGSPVDRIRLRSTVGEEVRLDAWMAAHSHAGIVAGRLTHPLQIQSDGTKLVDVTAVREGKDAVRTNATCSHTVCETTTREEWRPLLVCNPQSCYYQWVLWIITEQVCEYITEPCPDPEP